MDPRTFGYDVLVKKKNTGKEMQMKADKIMAAVGRESNADLSKVHNEEQRFRPGGC